MKKERWEVKFDELVIDSRCTVVNIGVEVVKPHVRVSKKGIHLLKELFQKEIDNAKMIGFIEGKNALITNQDK